jgi:hypothetical protein
MVKAFGKRWGNHSSFKVGSVHRSGFPTFTINHFNGPVTYSAEGFLNRNLDSLSPDFVSLLRGNTTGYEATAGGEGTDSINLFVRGLFSGKAIATQIHPRNELYKLNVYGTHLIFVHPSIWCYVAVQVKARSSSLTSILPRARRYLAPSSLSFQRSMKVELCSFVTAIMNRSLTPARCLLVQPTTNCRSVTGTQ